MKGFGSVLLGLGFVSLIVATPAWARGHGGGHSHTARAPCIAHGGSVEPSSALGSQEFHNFSNCPARLQEGTFCPLHGLHLGGTFYPTAAPPQGTPESDLGPWWIFLFLGRNVVRGVRWLIG